MLTGVTTSGSMTTSFCPATSAFRSYQRQHQGSSPILVRSRLLMPKLDVFSNTGEVGSSMPKPDIFSNTGEGCAISTPALDVLYNTSNIGASGPCSAESGAQCSVMHVPGE